jgi:hypothetical protein
MDRTTFIIIFVCAVVFSCVVAYFITPRFKNDPEGRAKFIEHL